VTGSNLTLILPLPCIRASYFEISARHSLPPLPYLAICRAEVYEQLDPAKDVESQFVEEPDGKLIARHRPDAQLSYSSAARRGDHCCCEPPSDSQAAVWLAHHERFQLRLLFPGDQPGEPDKTSSGFGDPYLTRAYPIEVLVKLAPRVRTANTRTPINAAVPTGEFGPERPASFEVSWLVRADDHGRICSFGGHILFASFG
jgi:hypothetical protein